MNLPLTPRNFAKVAANATVSAVAASTVKRIAVNHTHFEKDDNIVGIVAGLVAWVVSDKARPLTDAAVDTVADFIVEKREAHKENKKDTPES
jgi:hypothetical protein